MAASLVHDTSCADSIDFVDSVFTTIYESSRTLGPHRNVVYQPWTAQPVPVQPIYDETITPSAFFLTTHQFYSADETVTKPYPQFNEKRPRLVPDDDAILMSNIVTTTRPNWDFGSPRMPPVRRCETALEFLKAMYDLLEGIYPIWPIITSILHSNPPHTGNLAFSLCI